MWSVIYTAVKSLYSAQMNLSKQACDFLISSGIYKQFFGNLTVFRKVFTELRNVFIGADIAAVCY